MGDRTIVLLNMIDHLSDGGLWELESIALTYEWVQGAVQGAELADWFLIDPLVLFYTVI